MAFHTPVFFLIFLPIVVVVYRLLVGKLSRMAANVFLMGSSIVFYALSGLRNLPVIFLSLLVNHLVGQRISGVDDKRGKWWLVTGIAFNVSLLCWFKYPSLFPTAIGATHFVGTAGLPLGVSFFTIQQIMYLMDIRERLAQPSRLFDHAQALFYFPYISAGPITHPQEMLRELHSEQKRHWKEDIGRGFVRFALGLFKKIVLADNLAVVVSAGYAATGELGAVEALLVCCCCTLQIYFDFSGYCDMAIGVGRMLGHAMPENFDNPLRSTSISEFWQRWHITLTSFITTYLFTPMIRSWGKVSTGKAMVAIVIAMAVAGVWHGAGWVFLAFGLIHGIGLAVRLWWKASKRRLPNGLGTAITFLFVTLAFIYFRSPDLRTAGNMLASVFGVHGIVSPASLPDNSVVIALRSNWAIPAACFVVALVLIFLGPTSRQVAWNSRFSPALAMGVCPLILISLLFVNSTPTKGFIYGDRQSRLQTLVSSNAGFSSEGSFGSEKVVVGHDGWLYYSPGLTYALGEPFLNADVLRSRSKSMVDKERETEPNPDPRPALFGLLEDTRRQGIHLVLVPVPDKVMLQPLQITACGPETCEVPDNPSFRPLVSELKQNGADVFDWRPQIVRRDDVRFLKRDTHWTPAFMEEYGAQLASHISAQGVLPPVDSARRYKITMERHSNRGDLAALLRLLPGPAQFPLESVETHPVVDTATGLPAAPDRAARVLLLGDSFTNIYSLSSLGWGEHAGLAQQLARALNQPLDVMAINGAGATEVRLELVRAARDGRLKNKKVLIYEFAIADLAVENWRVVHFSGPTTLPPEAEMKSQVDSISPAHPDRSPSGIKSRPPVPRAAKLSSPSPLPGNSPGNGDLQIVAEVTVTSKVPEPGVATYRDCVGIMKVVVSSAEHGELADKSILVAYWVMRNDVLMEAAKYKVGDKLRMTLIPFEKAEAVVRGTQRSDDTHDYDSPLFWATRADVLSK